MSDTYIAQWTNGHTTKNKHTVIINKLALAIAYSDLAYAIAILHNSET